MVSAKFDIDASNPLVKEGVDDLRAFMGFDSTAPAIDKDYLEQIVPKYFYPDGPFSTSVEFVEAVSGIFENNMASTLLTDHIIACQDLYKKNGKLLGASYWQGNEAYNSGDYVGALECYMNTIMHEAPPIGLLYSLSLLSIGLSAVLRAKTGCTISQTKGLDYKLPDILTNIMFNLIKKWFISDNDDIFVLSLIRALRPREYEKHIAGKENTVNMPTQTRLLYNYLMKRYPLQDVSALQLSYKENVFTGPVEEKGVRQKREIERIDYLRGIMASMTRCRGFQEAMKAASHDPMIAEYSLIQAYLYKKPRMGRLMAYYGHQLSQFGLKSREFSTKVDHKDVQILLRQLFQELLDLLNIIIDEDFITQGSIGMETSVNVLRTIIKVYQFISSDRLNPLLSRMKIRADGTVQLK